MRGCRGRLGRRKQRVAHAHRLRRKAKLRIALNLEVSVRLVLGMLLVNELGPIALVRDEALSRVLRAAGAGVSASAAASLAARHAAQHERSVCWAALHSYTTKLERRTSIRLSATPVARSKEKEEGSCRGQGLLGEPSPQFLFLVLEGEERSHVENELELERSHARTVRTDCCFCTLRGKILPPPSVQFNLYQGEVLPYNPGTRDWVESETPQAPTQSARGQSRADFFGRRTRFSAYVQSDCTTKGSDLTP